MTREYNHNASLIIWTELVERKKQMRKQSFRWITDIFEDRRECDITHAAIHKGMER